MTTVTFKRTRYTVDSVYQWDTGRILEIRGLSLSAPLEIHFTNSARKTVTVVEASVDEIGVITALIPNELLEKHYPIVAYICSRTEDKFTTLYEIKIPVVPRNTPHEETPSEPEVVSRSFMGISDAALGTNAIQATVVNAEFEEV